MKNCKKLIALCLALATIFSFTVFASAAGTDISASGDSASASVNLSSTVDGSLTGDPAATAMSVTVPTVLPIAVGTDGTVTTATDAKIVNNSYGAVRVASVTLEAAGGWRLTAFGNKSSLASEKVDSNKLGFSITLGNGAAKNTIVGSSTSQQLLSAPETGCYMSGVGDAARNSVSVKYDAIVTPVSKAVTNTGIAAVLFVVEWDI